MIRSLLRLLATLSVGVIVLTACDDILDKSAKSAFMDSPAYWSNVAEVASFTNDFYTNFDGYGQDGFLGWFYYKSFSDDQVNPTAFNWSFYAVPSRSDYWDDAFAQIKRANSVIRNVGVSTLSAELKTTFTAVARLNRAWLYFQLVREYGDVPWITTVAATQDDRTLVASDRTDRDIVVDSIVADIDFAVAHLSEATDKTQWSSDMALALLSDVCLYEGTYCRYRTRADNGKAPNESRARNYLRKCVMASEALIISGRYALTADYGDVYHSVDLSHCREVIFFRNYEREVMTHGLIAATTASQQVYGLTKDAVDAFLFRDGKPKATTALDTTERATVNADGNYSIAGLLQRRDKRLSAITDSIVYFKGATWSRPCSDGAVAPMASSTGYGIRKFDNTTLDSYYRTGSNTNYTDAPIFWYAVVLLNDAEALAELGSITQDDLDVTVNLLQRRAGLPPLTLRPPHDPANKDGVSNLLFEIRRTRRCELMLDNWYRYWDLVRWHQLDKLDSRQHPNVNRGAQVAISGKAEVTLDADNYIVPSTETRIYKPKYYFFPVPAAVIKANPAVSQNPGWQ